MEKLENYILYAGLTGEEYAELVPAIHRRNQAYLRIFSSIASALFLLLALVGEATGAFLAVNVPVFFICFLVSAAILAGAYFLTPRFPGVTDVLVYVFEILLYIFSIAVSLLHPDMTAVSAVAFLLVIPLLFLVRPVHQICLTAAAVIAFIIIVRQAKQPAVAEADFWNMISYGLVGIVEAAFAIRIKMRALLQEKRIVYLSETDVLTGTKNRNCYERRLRDYPGRCSKCLLCIFADVNGLHELNNTAGHEAGDRMLRTVAGEILSRCGAEDTYRIGGDEFVALLPDVSPERGAELVSEMEARLSLENYHVSFGLAGREKPVQDIETLVKEAEACMYRAKSDFYRRPENSRRKR